jgi:carbonic anhydrase/acetyltransferase-like protein (isoleucine patch superfamily)
MAATRSPCNIPFDFRRRMAQNCAIMKILDRLSRSNVVKSTLTLIVYGFYACILGASCAPSALLLVWAYQRFLGDAMRSGQIPGPGALALFSLFIGAAAFVFFFFGLLLMGCIIRLFSLGVKPGRYEGASPVVLLWIILNGVFTMAWRIILPIVPMTPFSQMFYKIVGCRIGKNVWINTINLIDSYMITIGDNSIIGGDAVLSPHVYENGKLIIEPIVIGKNCLIGGHSYISPGVTVGDGSIVGMKAFVRKGKQLPAGSRMTAVAGLPLSRAADLERGTYTRIKAAIKN